MSVVARGRQLRDGQASRVHIYDRASRSSTLVFSSTEILVEAPNVLDDDTLLVNANGDLWLLKVPANGVVADESALVPVPAPGVGELNNDHVIVPGGHAVVASCKDGDLYRIPLPQGGTAERITRAADAKPAMRKYYLHDIAPDGRTLAVILGERSVDGAWTTNVALVDPAEQKTTLVTRDAYPNDGCAFTPSGGVVFNTERFSPGTAQLALHNGEGSLVVRITDDTRVNWFPHVAPDGQTLLYLSYEPGVSGHPADHPVELRSLPWPVAHDGVAPVPETLVTLVGGQGTVNVPPWAPDSSWFAYCDYPLS